MLFNVQWDLAPMLIVINYQEERNESIQDLSLWPLAMHNYSPAEARMDPTYLEVL